MSSCVHRELSGFLFLKSLIKKQLPPPLYQTVEASLTNKGRILGSVLITRHIYPLIKANDVKYDTKRPLHNLQALQYLSLQNGVL